eukprot:2029464-Ditylum_brightwellii.AAC.1
MHAKTYLSKVLKNHGRECGTKEEDKVIKPIHPDSIKELETTAGPSSEAESNQLEAEEGFSYHSMIVHHHHAVATKQSNGHIAISDRPLTGKFIGPEKANQLAIYVNAVHATAIKQRKSMGRQTALFAETAIAYTTKWQITVATSSTKAELIQAILAAKVAKYLET